MLGADLHVDDRLALPELHGDDAGAADIDEVGQLVAADGAAGRGEHHVEIAPGGFILRQRHDGGDALALLQRQDVDQRLAARVRRRHRQPPDLFLVDLALRGEEQHRRMRRGHEQAGDKILVAGLHAGAALAAAALRPIGRERHALDVAGVRDRDHHVLALDQVLVLDLVFLLGDDGSAWGRELGLHVDQFGLDDLLHARPRPQDFQIIGDLHRELVEFVGNFFAAERGQPLQTQLENGLGLLQRQPRRTVGRHPVAGIVDQRDHRLDIPRRPVARHQRVARGVRVGRGADHANDLVDIGDRNRKTDQDMGAVAGLVEQEFGTARDDLLAERDEQRQQVLQVHRLRTTLIQRQHVGRKVRLQRRETVELIEHDVRHRFALQLDDHAKTVAVGFVAQIGDALDLLLAHQFGDALDHGGLVHLVGNFGDDDRFAILADGVDRDLAAHHDRAAAEVIGGADSLTPEDDAAGRKIRTRNDVDEIVDA